MADYNTQHKTSEIIMSTLQTHYWMHGKRKCPNV